MDQIDTELAKNNITNPTIKDVRNAGDSSRSRKLPESKVFGKQLVVFFKTPLFLRKNLVYSRKIIQKATFYQVSDKGIKIRALVGSF